MDQCGPDLDEIPDIDEDYDLEPDIITIEQFKQGIRDGFFTPDDGCATLIDGPEAGQIWDWDRKIPSGTTLLKWHNK